MSDSSSPSTSTSTPSSISLKPELAQLDDSIPNRLSADEGETAAAPGGVVNSEPISDSEVDGNVLSDSKSKISIEGGMCPLSELYAKWCSELKVELKQKSAVNVEQRMEKITSIINEVTRSRSSTAAFGPFVVSESESKAMLDRINNKIESWRGVEIEVCKNKQKKSFEAYQATARNWFNRNKAKIYGNHLFYDLIFRHTLKVRIHCILID